MAGASGAAIATKTAVGLVTLAPLTTGAVEIARVVGPDGTDRRDPAGTRTAESRPASTTAEAGPAANGVDLPFPGRAPFAPPSDGSHPSQAPPAGEITSSTPDVVPGVTDTKPAAKPPGPEPGTSERGRPAPGLPTERRTRPVPPGLLGATTFEASPPVQPAPRMEAPPVQPAPGTSQPGSGVSTPPPPPDPAPETPPQP